MASVENLREQRFLFLHRLYEETGGNRFTMVSMRALGQELGLSESETDTVVQYLEGEGLLAVKTLDGMLTITHFGVRETEDALSSPEKATQYFPPVNVINISHMQDSQIQQGTSHSVQSGRFTSANLKDLATLIVELKSKIADLGLDRKTEHELRADVQAVESQISSPRPKDAIIREGLGSIRRVLEGAGGSLVARGLLTALAAFLG